MRHSRKIAFIAILVATEIAAADLAPRIAIIRASAVGPFSEASRAIVDELKRRLHQPEILTFDLDGDETRAASVLEEVRRASPQLVITVGSLATAAVLRQPADTAVVFSMVLYPRESGFLAGSRKRTTGASLDIPLDVQFTYLRSLFPEAHRVGVLYSEDETGEIVREARKAAAAHDFVLIATPVSDPSRALAELNGLMEKVDVLWSVADSHVFSPQTTSALILASLRRHVPLFGLSVAHVRAGAVAALYCDYEDIGRQTAELSLRVLAGEAPATLPVSVPRHVALALNLRSAQRLDLAIPEKLQAEAREVIR
jgi:putative tryptophan/tyrosine transport system substrate-binding protein